MAIHSERQGARAQMDDQGGLLQANAETIRGYMFVHRLRYMMQRFVRELRARVVAQRRRVRRRRKIRGQERARKYAVCRLINEVYQEALNRERAAGRQMTWRQLMRRDLAELVARRDDFDDVEACVSSCNVGCGVD
ncbi:MAG: hypothetical protein SGPRY_003078 [Prymnesium sp.]